MPIIELYYGVYFNMNKTNHHNQNELTSPTKQLEDVQSELSLRPDSFDNFIGLSSSKQI